MSQILFFFFFLLGEIQNYSTKKPVGLFHCGQKPNLPFCMNPVGDSHSNSGVNFFSLALGVWLFSLLFVCFCLVAVDVLTINTSL